ncbi:hypothetical protein DYB32_010187 [Aphanomyces invadans]|uniref:Tc1-like transposase DDE domain-containing protein n=1 Tax=Aphanomyces invadans TaxID=157072 RepID=A0A418AGI1_9STRA|nr:hypothetical protein DYB32_010187 [Aphanomyces invadans]
MKAVRQVSHMLTTAHMVTWIKNHYPMWIQDYYNTKSTPERAYKSVLGLCQQFAHRHGFAQRVPCYSKLKRAELELVQITFATSFWTKYGAHPLRDIVNIDETAVYYDMPPRRTWAEVGEDSRVDSAEKHSERLTVVMGACADGMSCFLPWMDDSVWEFYLNELLKFELIRPSVLLVDNLATHVSSTSYKLVDEEFFWLFGAVASKLNQRLPAS